jgi:hypothetical protein
MAAEDAPPLALDAPAGSKDATAGGTMKARSSTTMAQEEAPTIQKTPRLLEALQRIGLMYADLQPRTLASFSVPGEFMERTRMRYEHYETKRMERIQLALAERAKVIAESQQTGDGPSGPLLVVMESLLDKESKRLEQDLKAQLRFHNAVQRENDAQLNKEDQTRQKDARRVDRKKFAEKQLAAKAADVHDVAAAHKKLNDDHNGKLQQKREDARAKQVSDLLEEELRLQAFRNKQAERNDQKSQAWKAKLAKMQAGYDEVLAEKDKNGRALLDTHKRKLATVEKNRADDRKAQMMRCEEQQLHLEDVRMKKDRIDRQDDYRRGRLNQQISDGVERVETLLGLKEQIQLQRMARAVAGEGARAISLQRDCGVGPGQYEQHRDACFQDATVPKMVKSNISHEQFVEDIAKVTAGNPAVGSYDPTRLPNGELIDQCSGIYPKMGNTKKTSYLDDAIRLAKPNPGPGTYEAKPQLSHIGSKLVRDYIKDQGDDENAERRWPMWARPNVDSPGPMAYTIDKFQRKDRLQRAQKSMPSLTKAMLMNH